MKTQSECNFLHIKVDYPLERPQNTKPPCKYFHLQSLCNNESCTFGHVELTERKWYRYFASTWPQAGYSRRARWIVFDQDNTPKYNNVIKYNYVPKGNVPKDNNPLKDNNALKDNFIQKDNNVPKNNNIKEVKATILMILYNLLEE